MTGPSPGMLLLAHLALHLPVVILLVVGRLVRTASPGAATLCTVLAVVVLVGNVTASLVSVRRMLFG